MTLDLPCRRTPRTMPFIAPLHSFSFFCRATPDEPEQVLDSRVTNKRNRPPEPIGGARIVGVHLHHAILDHEKFISAFRLDRSAVDPFRTVRDSPALGTSGHRPVMVVAQAPHGAGPGDNDAPGPDGQRKRRDNQQRPGQGGEHRPGGDNQERQRPAEGPRPPREAPGAVLPAAPGNPAAAPTAPRGPQMAPGFHEGRPEGRPPRPTQQPGAASAPRPLPRPPSHRAPHPQSDPPRAIRSRSARPPSSPSRRDPLRFPVCRDQRLRVSPRRQRPLPSVRRRPLRQGQLLPLLRQRQLRRLPPLQLRSRHRQPGPHPLPGSIRSERPAAFPHATHSRQAAPRALPGQVAPGATRGVDGRPLPPADISERQSKIFAASAASAARKAVVGLLSRNRATAPSFAKATA